MKKLFFLKSTLSTNENANEKYYSVQNVKSSAVIFVSSYHISINEFKEKANLFELLKGSAEFFWTFNVLQLPELNKGPSPVVIIIA